jgi:hypothetical protein
MPWLLFTGSGEKNPHNQMLVNHFQQWDVLTAGAGIEVAYLSSPAFSGTRQTTCIVARAADSYVTGTYDLKLPLP